MARYRDIEESRYARKVEEISAKLPKKAVAFINSKYGVYQPGTKARYCEDLLSFFGYIADALRTGKDAASLDSELAEVTPQDIEQYLAYLSRYEDDDGRVRHNSPVSLKRSLSAIRSFYKYMAKNRFVERDPAALVDAPRVRDKDIIALDEADKQAVLSAVTEGTGLTGREQAHLRNHSVRDEAVLSVLLGTGIRVSELVGLDLGDVDMARSRLKVIRKGGGEDHVYFGSEVADALTAYLAERSKAHPADADRDALFISQECTRLSVRSVQRLIKKYGRLTQMGESIHPHSCRKTFATSALEENDLAAVAATLGQKSTATTSKYYTKISEQAKRNVAKMSVFQQQDGGEP